MSKSSTSENSNLIEEHVPYSDLVKETKLLQDTLDLLLNKSIDQKKMCEQLKQENRYLQDYVDSLMDMGDVLNK